jgi:hypothetical protein
MSACFCRGGPTCCRVVAARYQADPSWNVLADWSAEQYRVSSEWIQEWEWEQRLAEYQGA